MRGVDRAEVAPHNPAHNSLPIPAGFADFRNLPMAGGFSGGVSRAAKGADCKSAGYAFAGSSPASPTNSKTNKNRRVDGGLELPAKLVPECLGHPSIVITMDTNNHLLARRDDGAELAAAEQRLLA